MATDFESWLTSRRESVLAEIIGKQRAREFLERRKVREFEFTPEEEMNLQKAFNQYLNEKISK